VKYHKTCYEIKKILDTNNVWFEVFEHKPVRTSEEAAKIRTGYTLHQGAKALIVRVKSSGEKRFVMLVVPGDKRLDNKKVKSVLEATDVRFASETEVKEVTGGVLPGGVPPFGNLFGLQVYVDPGVLGNKRIVFNAGDRRVSLGMKSEDYFSLVKPNVVDIAA